LYTSLFAAAAAAAAVVTIGTTTSRSILLPGKSMDQNRAAYLERRIFVLLVQLLSSSQIIDNQECVVLFAVIWCS